MVNEQKDDCKTVYQIKVQGKLDQRWTDWFNGLEVAGEGENQDITSLTGPVDQAALRGILNRIWDLNLTLISVAPIESEALSNGGES